MPYTEWPFCWELQGEDWSVTPHEDDRGEDAVYIKENGGMSFDKVQWENFKEAVDSLFESMLVD